MSEQLHCIVHESQKVCELMGRALVALGLSPLDARFSNEWAFDGIRSICKCWSLILRLDDEEEISGALDSIQAQKDVESALSACEHVLFDPREMAPWIDQLGSFLLLEREVLARGYECVDPVQWYRAKCVDVRWAAYQLARICGLPREAAQRIVLDMEHKFLLLEMFDDLIDGEHSPMLKSSTRSLNQLVDLGLLARNQGLTLRRSCLGPAAYWRSR